MKLPRQPRNTLTNSMKYINTSVTERKRRNVSYNQWLGSSSSEKRTCRGLRSFRQRVSSTSKLVNYSLAKRLVTHVEEAVRVHLIDR